MFLRRLAMKNGTDKNVVEQFNRIANLPDLWDFNQHYQKSLLKLIPNGCRSILDVGCGTGELTKKLAPFAAEVIGLDVAENMISEAKKRNSADGITYLLEPVEKYLEETGKEFDCIISIAALHHMDEERVLSLMKKRLAPGGQILALDLVDDKTLPGLIVTLVAAVLTPFMFLAHSGKMSKSPQEKEAWNEHAKYDTYLTVGKAKAIARRALGKAQVKRLMFFRYMLAYKRD
jgi:2-polyprenyl-3-methyl-5-hydroxy-6-metoxy-1,4-benzoquinol methylase